MAERHFELPPRPSLEHYRKQARRLQRAVAAGEPDALARVAEAAGPRRERLVLADAQRVIASEHGHGSWADFRRAIESRRQPDRPVARIGSGDGRDQTEPITLYEQRAVRLRDAAARRAPDALRRIRAHLPRLAAAPDEQLSGTPLPLRDARIVVAAEHGFPTWRDLVRGVERVQRRSIDAAARRRQADLAAGHRALLAGDLAALTALLGRAPQLATPLLEAITQPRLEGRWLGRGLGVDEAGVRLLLEAGADRDRALIVAACFDRVELMGLLLAAGARDDAIDVWGLTPLQMAAYHAASAAADLLAARRIVPSAFWLHAALGRCDLLEARLGPDGAVRVVPGEPRPNLADVGWAPDAPPIDDPPALLGEALCHAAHNGRLAAVRWLLAHGAPVDIVHFGLTPLHFAVSQGEADVAAELLTAGASTAARDPHHHGRPLDWAHHGLGQRLGDAGARATFQLLQAATPRPAR